MTRSLGAGQVGRGPWLLLSERRSSKVLDQLLTQEGVDLESEPLWAVSLSQAWAPWFLSRRLGEGADCRAALPHFSSHGSICGNSWEGPGSGIIRGLKVIEMREEEIAKDR